MSLSLEENSFDKEKAIESVNNIASENKLCALATVSEDSNAFNATAFYVFDTDFKFYILTEPDTDHCKNLENNSSISLSVYDSHQNWSDEKNGLQVFGTAEIVNNDKLEDVLDLYLDRFPGLEEYVSSAEEMSEIESEFYVIEPKRIKIFDESKFGRENWLNLIFEH